MKSKRCFWPSLGGFIFSLPWQDTLTLPEGSAWEPCGRAQVVSSLEWRMMEMMSEPFSKVPLHFQSLLLRKWQHHHRVLARMRRNNFSRSWTHLEQNQGKYNLPQLTHLCTVWTQLAKASVPSSAHRDCESMLDLLLMLWLAQHLCFSCQKVTVDRWGSDEYELGGQMKISKGRFRWN